MDISYTSELDAKRYEKLIGKALGLGALRVSYFCWCMAVFGGLSLCGNLIRHHGFGYADWFFLVLAVNPLLMLLLRRLQARQYMKMLRRTMCGETTSHCRLTDEGYEVSCGKMSQKLPWKSLASEYCFFDDDTVALLQPRGLPSIVLCGLSKHGIARKELEKVLLQAGVGERRVSGLRRTWGIVSSVIGSLLVLVSATGVLEVLLLPGGHGQLVFSNECAIPVEKATVSFGKNTVELNGIPPQGKTTEHFLVGDDCTCRAVVTFADGLVVSNSYGYYCYGMDCGTVGVTVTEDKHVMISDKYIEEGGKSEDKGAISADNGSMSAWEKEIRAKMMPSNATECLFRSDENSRRMVTCLFAKTRCKVDEASFLAFAKEHNYALATNCFENTDLEGRIENPSPDTMHIVVPFDSPTPSNYLSYSRVYTNNGGLTLVYDRDRQILYGHYSHH